MRPAPAAEDYSQKPFATPEDRLHFCSYEQAYAAIPDEIPQHGSSGHRWVSVNLSTGHSIPCADLLIATGYVAGADRDAPAASVTPLAQKFAG